MKSIWKEETANLWLDKNNMNKESLLKTISREDSLDIIQNYVENQLPSGNYKKNDISSEMFYLFFNVIELGKELRLSLQEKRMKNSEAKIADIFLVLISICNSMQINLFDALVEKEEKIHQCIS